MLNVLFYCVFDIVCIYNTNINNRRTSKCENEKTH